jgi:hypothetical protein
VKRAEKYGQIVQTRSGGYELVFPTRMNEDLEPYIGKDFDMDVVQEGESVKVILKHDKRSKPKKLALTKQMVQRHNSKIPNIGE